MNAVSVRGAENRSCANKQAEKTCRRMQPPQISEIYVFAQSVKELFPPLIYISIRIDAFIPCAVVHHCGGLHLKVYLMGGVVSQRFDFF